VAAAGVGAGAAVTLAAEAAGNAAGAEDVAAGASRLQAPTSNEAASEPSREIRSTFEFKLITDSN